MPVEIRYRGRFGNHLCQYIAARIFAETHQLNLLTELDHQGILDVRPHKEFPNDTQHTDDKKTMSFLDFKKNDTLTFYGNKHYIFDDYFENGDYFSQYETLIKSFFNLPKPDPQYKNDVAIHIRLGDSVQPGKAHPTASHKLQIDISWYEEILQSLDYNQLYIISTPPKDDTEKSYLDQFNQFKPKFHRKSVIEDFNFMLNFNTIIPAIHSTFPYWAAFLGPATTIFTHKKYGLSPQLILGHERLYKTATHRKNQILSYLLPWKHFNTHKIKNMNNIRNTATIKDSPLIDIRTKKKYGL